MHRQPTTFLCLYNYVNANYPTVTWNHAVSGISGSRVRFRLGYGGKNSPRSGTTIIHGNFDIRATYTHVMSVLNSSLVSKNVDNRIHSLSLSLSLSLFDRLIKVIKYYFNREYSIIRFLF